MAGLGSGSSNGVRVEPPLLVVRKSSHGFIIETFEQTDGMFMATVISCKDADHASRVARATLQDVERTDDEARADAIAARGIGSATA